MPKRTLSVQLTPDGQFQRRLVIHSEPPFELPPAPAREIAVLEDIWLDDPAIPPEQREEFLTQLRKTGSARLTYVPINTQFRCF